MPLLAVPTAGSPISDCPAGRRRRPRSGWRSSPMPSSASGRALRPTSLRRAGDAVTVGQARCDDAGTTARTVQAEVKIGSTADTTLVLLAYTAVDKLVAILISGPGATASPTARSPGARTAGTTRWTSCKILSTPAPAARAPTRTALVNLLVREGPPAIAVSQPQRAYRVVRCGVEVRCMFPLLVTQLLPYDASKSGRVIAPSRSSAKPGLYATSQTWPSGSRKQPA
jgi:hypothetical protein